MRFSLKNQINSATLCIVKTALWRTFSPGAVQLRKPGGADGIPDTVVCSASGHSLSAAKFSWCLAHSYFLNDRGALRRRLKEAKRILQSIFIYNSNISVCNQNSPCYFLVTEYEAMLHHIAFRLMNHGEKWSLFLQKNRTVDSRT